MIFQLISKMNIYTYFWLKNPHPDIRFALISLTYEETAFQDSPILRPTVTPVWLLQLGLHNWKPWQECSNKCKEYNGLPSAFSDFNRTTAGLPIVNDSFTSYYVDAEYNFHDETWYSRMAFDFNHVISYSQCNPDIVSGALFTLRLSKLILNSSYVHCRGRQRCQQYSGYSHYWFTVNCIQRQLVQWKLKK